MAVLHVPSMHVTWRHRAPCCPCALAQGDALEASLSCVDLLPRLGIQPEWGEELYFLVVCVPPPAASFELAVCKGAGGNWAKGAGLGAGAIRLCRSTAPRWESQGGDVVRGMELLSELCVQDSAGSNPY